MSDKSTKTEALNPIGTGDKASVLDLIVMTGMSGSGKTVALHALEDAGYYCVDNLPPELLLDLVRLNLSQGRPKVAVAVDVRSAAALPMLPQLWRTLSQGDLASRIRLRSLFLDCSDEVLLRRFSETRRSHPLSNATTNTVNASSSPVVREAIAQERHLLAPLRDRAYVLDTSMLRAAQLLSYVKEWLQAQGAALTLVFESFAFKRGVPLDADFVFDVRMLPNPHYVPHLKPLTGQDAPVAAFLAQEPQVAQMLEHIDSFLHHWLPALLRDHRSYVTVGVGCTGGQHRSVYLVEQLHQRFCAPAPVGTDVAYIALKRHRELDGAK